MRATFIVLCLSLTSILAAAIPTYGQPLIADDTVDTLVENSGGLWTITQGTQRQQTLFHSFTEFSPGSADVLFQLNGTQHAVQQIISRITGQNVSLINAQMMLTGGDSPDLFLLNPNGITFGAGAQLLLPGSLVVSTAESILFSDGLDFSAIAPSGAPMLTVSAPVGLQLGSASGPITVKNVGRGTPALSSLPGLALGAGKTLAFVGGPIAFDGGVLTAVSGRIDLGSVANGQVGLTPGENGWHLGFDEIQSFSDIHLSNRASLWMPELSPNKDSGIFIQGETIDFNNSQVVASAFNGQPGSDIRLSAQNLTLQNGSGLNTSAADDFSIGLPLSPVKEQAGDVVVLVRDLIDLRGISPDGSSSNIAALTLGSGTAGNVDVLGRQISLKDGGSIFSGVALVLPGSVPSPTAGQGAGGNVTVRATETIELAGVSPVSTLSSGLSTFTFGRGDAGTTKVSAPVIRVLDGATINSATTAIGNAGEILLDASSLTIRGVASNGLRSRVSANAETLDPILQQLFFLPALPTGDTGALDVTADVITVADGGTITVQHAGVGSAGSLKIDAGSVVIRDAGSLTANTVSGGGGNIDVSAQNVLLLRNSGLISAEAGGLGNGGNVDIQTTFLIGQNNSDIVANAFEGDGGNIDIAAQGILGLAFRDRLTPGNDITASSQFGISGRVDINNLDLDPSSSLVQLPNSLIEDGDRVSASCAEGTGSEFIATGRGGLPLSPQMHLSSAKPWIDMRDAVRVFDRAAGNTDTAATHRTQNTTQNTGQNTGVPQAGDELIEAITWTLNDDGDIALIAKQAVYPDLLSLSGCLDSEAAIEISSTMPVQ